MRVAIRVDASTEIGTGHLKRCLSLGHALRDRRVEARFVTRTLGLSSADSIRAAGFDVIELAAPQVKGLKRTSASTWTQIAADLDAAETIERLDGFDPDWAIVDHYGFDAAWHRAVSEALGCRIAVIDDLADRCLAADVLIDHNLAGAEKYRGLVSEQAIRLLGPRYALLGPGYAHALQHTVRDQVRSIGIFMGGVDKEDHSRLVLAACREAIGFGGEIEIATTSGNPNLSSLREAADASPSTRMLVDSGDLTRFFQRHDIQIGAGGGATWERCCIGSPTIAIVVADNQRMVLEPLSGLGVLVRADATILSVAGAVASLIDDRERREDLSRQARRLVDGRGASRVSESLVKS